MQIVAPLCRPGEGVLVLEADRRLPRVVVVTGDDCLAHATELKLGPGVYLAEAAEPGEPPAVYAGRTGGCVSQRVRRFAHDLALSLPSRIIAITGAGAPLTRDEACALERLMWMQMVGADVNITNVHMLFGKPLGPERYASLQDLARVALAWLSPHVPYLPPLLLPPVYTREEWTTPSPGLTVERWSMRRGPIAAAATVSEEGWVVQAGSLIRRRVARSSSVTPRVMREELAAWDMLEPTPDTRVWRLKCPVWCQGRTAASRFVLGSSGSGWRRDDDAERGILAFPHGR